MLVTTRTRTLGTFIKLKRGLSRSMRAKDYGNDEERLDMHL